TRISVVCGNIADQGGRASAIVNAANDRLAIGRGVAGALGAACGPRLAQECKLLIAQMTQHLGMHTVPTGSVGVTGAYDMFRAGAILHAVGPVCLQQGVRTDDQARQLRAAYDCVMRAAEALEFEIVAVPFLGAGIFQYPADESVELALLSVLALCPMRKVKEIRFVSTDRRLTKKMENLLGGASIVVASSADLMQIRARICQGSKGIRDDPSNVQAIKRCLQYSL
ncbi:hypothetical protein PFISCL1PPCAC_22444, partial [Pristionchus fissidentatus]